MKRTKFSEPDADDLADVSRRIAVKLEDLLAAEISAFKGPESQKGVVHATVIGLLRGSFYASVVGWCNRGGMGADFTNKTFTGLIEIELAALQSVAKSAGVIIEQDMKTISFGKAP